MTKIAIIIPARYASTRLPGKPLIKIAGLEMIKRVWDIACSVQVEEALIRVFIATDDERIEQFCEKQKIASILTSEKCSTGTDRVVEAVKSLENNDYKPDFVINLQGDNPLCPPWFIEQMISSYINDPAIEVSTPVINLSWDDLDKLRKNKEKTPFSGTCAAFDRNNNALYFSKNIIPAIRKEDKRRESGFQSPVFRQTGLYGYSYDSLMKISDLETGPFEETEGLEQLRFLENGIGIKCIEVSYREYTKLNSLSGVDSPEDISRAEEIIIEYQELFS